MKILVDVWGGELHCDHVARSICEAGPFLNGLVLAELNNGYLVNLRRCDNEAPVWGPKDAFDSRRGGKELPA